jgi:hypothetical protein
MRRNLTPSGPRKATERDVCTYVILDRHDATDNQALDGRRSRTVDDSTNPLRPDSTGRTEARYFDVRLADDCVLELKIAPDGTGAVDVSLGVTQGAPYPDDHRDDGHVHTHARDGTTATPVPSAGRQPRRCWPPIRRAQVIAIAAVVVTAVTTLTLIGGPHRPGENRSTAATPTPPATPAPRTTDALWFAAVAPRQPETACPIEAPVLPNVFSLIAAIQPCTETN